MSDTGPLTIVCVDPDSAERDATAAAIEAEDDLVAEPVAGAKAALELVEAGGHDCLVVEYDLGTSTGLELIERARELQPGLACILYTSASIEEVGGDRFGDVVIEYLSKDRPDAPERLQHLVRTVVLNRFHVGYPVPADEDERLAAVRSFDVDALSTLETFDRLTHLIANHFDIAVAFVGLVGEYEEKFIACYGADWDTLSREDSVCTYAILEDDVTVIEHVQDDPRFEANETLRELGVRSYAGANLTDADGQRIGQLCLIHDEPRSYADEELADLRLFADEVTEQLDLRRRLNAQALEGLPGE